MPRKRPTDADRVFDDLTGILVALPAWVGPIVVVATFLFFRFFCAWVMRSFAGDAGKVLGPLCEILAWVFAGLALLAWIFALIKKLSARATFNRQTGLGSIRQLSWREFETLIGEAFRRQGYTVAETGKAGADGGVDLILTKGGEETLVQCKRWKEWQVGVEKVRELYGIMAGRGSTNGILVTSGSFTKPARKFAEGKSVRLVDGPLLAELVAGIQAQSAPQVIRQSEVQVESVVCPQCGSAMTLRTAKKGPQPGSQFWGCTKYPACKGARPQELSRK